MSSPPSYPICRLPIPHIHDPAFITSLTTAKKNKLIAKWNMEKVLQLGYEGSNPTTGLNNIHSKKKSSMGKPKPSTGKRKSSAITASSDSDQDMEKAGPLVKKPLKKPKPSIKKPQVNKNTTDENDRASDFEKRQKARISRSRKS
jgi:hypothetical protein